MQRRQGDMIRTYLCRVGRRKIFDVTLHTTVTRGSNPTKFLSDIVYRLSFLRLSFIVYRISFIVYRLSFIGYRLAVVVNGFGRVYMYAFRCFGSA